MIEIKTGKKVWRLKGDTEIITTFAITPDGNTLVSASRSLLLKTWDLRTGTVIRSLKVCEMVYSLSLWARLPWIQRLVTHNCLHCNMILVFFPRPTMHPLL